MTSKTTKHDATTSEDDTTPQTEADTGVHKMSDPDDAKEGSSDRPASDPDQDLFDNVPL